MSVIKRISLLTFIFCCITAYSQQLPAGNPLLVHSNLPIAFNQVTVPSIVQAVDAVIKVSDARIEKITSVPAASKGGATTLMAFDELIYEIGDLSAKLQLISSTFTDDSTRNTANEAAEKLSVYSNSLYLNEALYNTMKQYASASKGKLKPNHEKFLNEVIVTFEKNGMKLNAAERKDLQALNEKLIAYSIQFDKNLAESKDSVEFSESELTGVPAITKAPWKRSNGKYMVVVNGPNYTEVMSNAESDATRHTMFLRYNNRAYPKNIQVLDSLFWYRRQFAEKLGFSSYAEYAVVDKMAKTPETVWQFEYDLQAKLTPHVTTEMNELRQLKHSLHPELPDSVFEWDLSYYRKKFLDTKYQLNTDEVKEYFEMNNTLAGMFTVYEKLFDIDIREAANVPVWYNKVKAYELYKDGKKIGNFYLDLFPRANKYTHFACFPISQYRVANGKEVVPVSALICNFPEGNAQQPSLLYHTDVVTLFHEFGHLVHSMLGRSDIASQGPFSVKGDFVEAPSQFLENWVWEYESLQLFAKHYKTGKVLPQSLFAKMKETRLVGVATNYIRQVYLGMLDFTYEDKYDSIKGTDLVQVSKDLNSMRQMPFVEGSHFIAGFTHLNGYAANYYGYLWSKVFAEDMFSVFKKNGVMDTKTGISYRKNILEKAATMEEIDMLRNFLQREPNSNAFLESLGIK